MSFTKVKALGVSVLLMGSMVFTVGNASAESVTFTLTNGTSYTLTEFYASPPNTKEWEEDILGEYVLEPGESVEITIEDGREDCRYDFLGVFESDEEAFEIAHTAISVCDGQSYTYNE